MSMQIIIRNCSWIVFCFIFLQRKKKPYRIISIEVTLSLSQSFYLNFHLFLSTQKFIPVLLGISETREKKNSAKKICEFLYNKANDYANSAALCLTYCVQRTCACVSSVVPVVIKPCASCRLFRTRTHTIAQSPHSNKQAIQCKQNEDKSNEILRFIL